VENHSIRASDHLSLPTNFQASDSIGVIEVPGIFRIEWDRSKVRPLEAGWGKEDVLYNLQTNMPVAVWETSVLEGIVITIPEVQTLMEGVTVSGMRLYDLRQVENIASAYRQLHIMIRDDYFSLSKPVMDRLNFTLSKDEVIDPGKFRGDNTVVSSPGGEVALLDGVSFFAPPPGRESVNLKKLWYDGVEQINAIPDPGERGLALFAFLTYNQFYFTANKRTAKFMASGVLMSNGINAINPLNRTRDAYNAALDMLYRTGNATNIMSYLSDSTHRYRDIAAEMTLDMDAPAHSGITKPDNRIAAESGVGKSPGATPQPSFEPLVSWEPKPPKPAPKAAAPIKRTDIGFGPGM